MYPDERILRENTPVGKLEIKEVALLTLKSHMLLKRRLGWKKNILSSTTIEIHSPNPALSQICCNHDPNENTIGLFNTQTKKL